jgi:hypothetical protein
MVEEMLAARGISVRHETIRQWGRKFGREFANRILSTCRACALGQPRDCDAVLGSAASANRISADSECEPVFFMTAARWFSTVRRLMPRSAAMFLLGWPASTSSMIWRWRAVDRESTVDLRALLHAVAATDLDVGVEE